MYQEYDMTSYKLYVIPTERFKRNTVRLIFSKPVKKEEISLFTLLLNVLFEGSKKYPTGRKIRIETDNLYGLGWSMSTTISGTHLVGCIQFNFLDEYYTEKGMMKKSIDFMKEILFHPNVENGKFQKEALEKVRYELIELIKTEKENHGKYARKRLNQELSSDSPISYSDLGYIEDYEKIDEKMLYDYYQTFLKTVNLDIFVCGRTKHTDWKKVISDFIPNNIFKKQKQTSYYITHKKFLKRMKTVIEKERNNQSILYLGCKVKELTLFEKQYVTYIYNYILGGGTDSLLFQNVREKESLCYSISSGFQNLDHLFLVKAGIDGKNFLKAKKLIQKQMEKMKNGEFSDSMIQNAITVYLQAKEELTDSVNGLIANVDSHVNFGYDLYEIQKEQIKKVTKEDLCALANKIIPQVTFLLEGEESHEKN